MSESGSPGFKDLQDENREFITNSKCGTTSHKLHQNHRHIIKDLPFGEKEVFLEINRRQFKCEKCKKPFSEDLDFVKKKRTYTNRLAHKTIQEVLENDIHSVAAKGGVAELGYDIYLLAIAKN